MIKYNDFLKKYRVLLIVLIVAVIAVIGFFSLHTLSKDSKNADRSISVSPKHRLTIEGLRFYGMNQGQRCLFITADRFSIEKKKLGFFRFSLANEARLQNAGIDIYRVHSQVITTPPAGADTGKGSTFKEVFSDETFSSFPVPIKSITSIIAEPLAVTLRDEKTVLTRITASRGTLVLTERSIMFEGNVRVLSGTSELMTDQLSFLPQKGLLSTKKRFVMKRQGHKYEGKRLTTDIYLKPIKTPKIDGKESE